MEVTDPFGNRLRFAKPLPGDSPRLEPERAEAAAGSDPRTAMTATTGGTLSLDAVKLEAFRSAVFAALADTPGGRAFAELAERVRAWRPEALRGSGCTWWVTVARLDPEARGRVRRERHRRSHRACLASWEGTSRWSCA